jgi:arylsulfatase A-like enzyme
MKPKPLLILLTLLASILVLPTGVLAQAKKPNILVIMGDDIGQTNVSAYSMGMMGYRTPNIDRIAKEGMIFTDYYAEQSCTAGRSSFITGQCTLRTGLSKVGTPGSPIGLQDRDVTMAQLLKAMGYATGQFGKNHLGDLNKYLPTVHGFDEFFGNLYHLNAEEEPERRTYPQDPKFKEMFGPRGVLRCKAIDTDDPTEQPRWGEVGKQTIEDSGPLTRKRMETIDDETSDAAVDYIQRRAQRLSRARVRHWPHRYYSTKLGKSHLDFSARWIHDFDVSNRVAGDGFNFSASLKF